MSRESQILLVNKNRKLRDAGIRMLTAAGFPVLGASTLREALTAISSRPVGLILCGLLLEDIQAVDFLKYLKSDPLRDKIPFIFYIQARSRATLTPNRAGELGAEEVIYYPVAAVDFFKPIRRYLPETAIEDSGATVGSSSFPESFLPRQEKPSAGGKSGGANPRAARLSLNGKEWAPGEIINHTVHGAMVETRLRGRQGNGVLLRYPMPGGSLATRGRLTHILLGDHERPMGMGISFRGDAAWRRIHSHIKAASAAPPADTGTSGERPSPSAPVATPKPPAGAPEKRRPEKQIVPADSIGVEVSRDGALFMYGEIVKFMATGAAITTPVLCKPGETLHVRFTLPGKQIVVQGRIEKVTLNDFKKPVGLKIGFPEDGKWPGIFTAFAEDEARSKTVGNARKKAPPPATGHTGRPKGPWTDTIVDSDKGPGPESIKHRFYKSLIGKRLGNYEIVSFLDAGSMGGVFKGWDIALERDVAIKVISYELSSQDAFVEMFFREARLVSRLNHPNIAHIYFIGNETGIVYYSMEFIHGKTLSELMGNDQRVQVEKAVEYLSDSCRALDCVWQEKIIHRDIKPANIMISEHETVKLLDFGVARKQKKGSAGIEEKIVGSPPYLSPETIREESVDLRSDIYSLGATFYHVLGGAPPFMDETLEGILRKHLDTLPVPLKEKLPDIPQGISDVIQKMLSKEPTERFQSYGEIIETLAAVA